MRNPVYVPAHIVDSAIGAIAHLVCVEDCPETVPEVSAFREEIRHPES
jgi:hypothetical protein